MADPLAPAARLADFLPYVLSMASNAVSSRIAEQYRSRFGLTVPEWRIMAVLGEGGSLTQRELVRLTLMDKVAVNRAVKGLAHQDLVARRPNTSDRRSHQLMLTSQGQAMHGRIMPLAKAIEARLFASFSPQERRDLRALLLRVRTAADGLEPGEAIQDAGADAG